jgi:hypothetical protein
MEDEEEHTPQMIEFCHQLCNQFSPMENVVLFVLLLKEVHTRLEKDMKTTESRSNDSPTKGFVFLAATKH